MRSVLKAAFGDLSKQAEQAFDLLGNDELLSVEGYEPLPTAAHAQFSVQLAERLGAALDADPSLGGDVCLTSDALSQACLDAAISRWSFPIFHRALSPLELEGYRQVAREEGIGQVVAELLLSPEMLLLIELGGEVGTDSQLAATQEERAAQLAFSLTGGPPDEAWFQRFMAAAGSEESERMAAIELTQTSGFEARIRELFSLYLGIRSQPRVQAFEGLLRGLEPRALEREMRAELERFQEHVLSSSGNQFAELLTSPLAFPEGELAELLGVAAAPLGVELSERPGILLRAATLSDGQNHTSPILRGLFVLEQFLCVELPTPDPNLVQERLSEVTTDRLKQTTRERVDAVTQSPACAACHGVINSFGFALEGFDAIGRARELELVFDEAGEVVAEHAVDVAVDVATLPTQSVTSAAELAFAIAADPRSAECFARRALQLVQLAEHTDSCALERSTEALTADNAELGVALLESAVSRSRGGLRIPTDAQLPAEEANP